MNRPVDADITDLKLADMQLDAVLRARHADAVASLSPQVQAQLTQRRNAALRGQTRHPRHGLRYAMAGFATLSALAIGLQFIGPINPPIHRPVSPAQSIPASTPIIAAAAQAPNTRSATLLDEDPEFYSWLASNDAALVTQE